ncbi:MAG: hypothetical protein RAP03_09020 [Candidatus Electryonea clarkiae]|nr:hypothetical protein [Candidatus Electryonea clarkiae]
MNKIKLIIVTLLLTAFVASCVTSGVKSVKVTPPSSDDGYTNIPFKKAINPAFTTDVANKWIRCKVQFWGQMDQVTDLPAKYRKDYVRFGVSGIDGPPPIAGNVVIPKAKSDLVFELKQQEIIEIFAYIVPLSSTSAITGRSQSDVLFVVEKIIK